MPAQFTDITVTHVEIYNQPRPLDKVYISGTFTLTEPARSMNLAMFVDAYAIEETASGVTRSGLGSPLFYATPGETTGIFTLETSVRALNAAHVQKGDTIKIQFYDSFYKLEYYTTDPFIYCFYPGTMIATPSGEAAVETLAIGDMVLRQDGTAAPIRWIGRNSIALPFANKMKALPIRIRRHALDESVPCRDLLVSPDHAILVDGNLIQAGALVNGTSVIRETDVPMTFIYYHIELADHALVMAENTPAETFIDNVDRMRFDNWAEHEALYGQDAPLVEMDLPRAKSQRQVPAATRNRLAERAITLGYAAGITEAA